MRHPGRIEIGDLDDHLMMQILSKLPASHCLNAGKTCKRLHRLANDSRMWLTVSQPREQGVGPGQPSASFHPMRDFSTLQAAVNASRPGDTIHLFEGRHKAEAVSIRHPIRLVGRPGSVLVCEDRRAEACLDIYANCQLEGLRVEVHAATCIRHHCGTLRITKCRLECHTHRLDHLYCALVTHASHPDHAPAPTSTQPAASAGRTETLSGTPSGDGAAQEAQALTTASSRGGVGCTPSGAAHISGVSAEPGRGGSFASGAKARADEAAGPGRRRQGQELGQDAAPVSRLLVAETHIRGSLRAVRCHGNATPQHVRVILNGHNSHVYWFSVAGVWDGVSGAPLPSLPAALRPRRSAELLEKAEQYSKRRRTEEAFKTVAAA